MAAPGETRRGHGVITMSSIAPQLVTLPTFRFSD
jgi:hypothetical protein